MRAVAALESSRELPREESSSPRGLMTLKRVGLVVLLALIALRIALFFGRGGHGAPPEISGAGQTAQSAATAIGVR